MAAKPLTLLGVLFALIGAWQPALSAENLRDGFAVDYSFHGGTVLLDFYRAVSGISGESVKVGNVLPFLLLLIGYGAVAFLAQRWTDEYQPTGLLTLAAALTIALHLSVMMIGIAYVMVDSFDTRNDLALIGNFAPGPGAYLGALGLGFIIGGVALFWKEATVSELRLIEHRLNRLAREIDAK